MEAVMYGLTPIENTEKFLIAFPLTKFNIFKKGSSLSCSKLFAFTPGTVICVPIRNTRMIKMVKKILFLTVFIFKASFSIFKNIMSIPSLDDFD